MHISILGDLPNSFEEHLSMLAVWLFIALVGTWAAWKAGFFRFPQSNMDWPSLYFSEFLTAFAVFLSTTLLITPLMILAIFSLKAGRLVDAKQIIQNAQTQGWLDVLSIIVMSLFLFGYYALLPYRAQKAILGPLSYGRNLASKVRDWFFGATSWLVCFPWTIVISQLMALIVFIFNIETAQNEQVAVKYLKSTLDQPLLFFVMSIMLVFIVPTLEESLFRGCLQNWLKGYLGRNWAIFIASAIFAIFHFSHSQGFENIELLITLFMLGCFLGFVYERQQSLFASIGLHSTFNAISVIAITFAT